MSKIHETIVTGTSAWIGSELSDAAVYTHQFSANEAAEIDTALSFLKSSGKAPAECERADFPLPTFANTLADALQEVRLGRGFKLLRGLDTEKYTDEDVGLIFWGLGLYLGRPVAQNPRGDILGHVFDHGRKYGGMAGIDTRGYQSHALLPYHTDGSDMVGLLCLRQAKHGGSSSIVSSVTLHNEFLKRRPDLLPVLYRGYYYIRREAALTDRPISEHRIPVFGTKDGFISCRIVPAQIEAACIKTGEPLADDEREALDLLVALANDSALHLDMYLEPGDIQLCNNHTILHSRTEFEDWPEPERQRHMVRLWLTFVERRALAEGFPELNGYVKDELVEPALS